MGGERIWRERRERRMAVSTHRLRLLFRHRWTFGHSRGRLCHILRLRTFRRRRACEVLPRFGPGAGKLRRLRLPMPPAVPILLGLMTPMATVAAEPVAEPERVRSVVEGVLAEPEFSRGESWTAVLQRYLLSLIEAVGEFFEGLPGWIRWVLLIWMVATLVAIILHLVWVLYQSMRGAGSAAPARRRGGPREWLGVRDLEFDSVYRRAAALREAGRWAEAVRHYYVASLLWLERCGAVAFEPSKTTRDYLAELTPRPRLRALFAPLTEAFERMAYGGAPATERGCGEAARAVERMRHEAPADATG